MGGNGTKSDSTAKGQTQQQAKAKVQIVLLFATQMWFVCCYQ